MPRQPRSSARKQIAFALVPILLCYQVAVIRAIRSSVRTTQGHTHKIHYSCDHEVVGELVALYQGKSVVVSGVEVRNLTCLAAGGFGVGFRGSSSMGAVMVKIFYPLSMKKIFNPYGQSQEKHEAWLNAARSDFLKAQQLFRVVSARAQATGADCFVEAIKDGVIADAHGLYAQLWEYFDGPNLAAYKVANSEEWYEVEKKMFEGFMFLWNADFIHTDIQLSNLLWNADAHSLKYVDYDGIHTNTDGLRPSLQYFVSAMEDVGWDTRVGQITDTKANAVISKFESQFPSVHGGDGASDTIVKFVQFYDKEFETKAVLVGGPSQMYP